MELHHFVEVSVSISEGKAQTRLLWVHHFMRQLSYLCYARRQSVTRFLKNSDWCSCPCHWKALDLSADMDGFQADDVGMPQFPEQHDLPDGRNRDPISLLR